MLAPSMSSQGGETPGCNIEYGIVYLVLISTARVTYYDTILRDHAAPQHLLLLLLPIILPSYADRVYIHRRYVKTIPKC